MAVAIAVTHEHRTYEPDGPYSFFRDIAEVAAGGILGDAAERLGRHMEEVHTEIEARSAEGIRAQRELAKLNDLETRAATTSTISGFTTPQYILDQYALFRGVHRSFIDQTVLAPIPRVGTVMHVPAITAADTEVIQATENTIISETDATGTDLLGGVPVKSVAGQFQYSIQMHDRAMDGGGAFDLVASMQLQQALDQALDVYALNQAITNGNSVTSGNTFAASWAATQWTGFYTDLANAREVLTDTAGVRYRPTHIFTTSDLESFVTRQLDAQGRPILLPQETPGQAPENADTQDNSRWAGYTGLIMPGAVRWFFDDNIPASGGNTQILVSRPSTILSLESEPYLRIFPETYATTLTVVAQLYEYACVIPRFPNATAVLTGAAYPTTLK